MIIDKETGAVHTDEVIITPQLTRTELLDKMGHRVRDDDKGSLTNDRVLIRVDDVPKQPFLMFIGFWFAGQKLEGIVLKLATPDYDRKTWKGTTEYLTKLLNDSIVRANLGEPHETVVDGYIIPESERVRNLAYHFDWGHVYSQYDDKGGGLGITVSYK